MKYREETTIDGVIRHEFYTGLMADEIAIKSFEERLEEARNGAKSGNIVKFAYDFMEDEHTYYRAFESLDVKGVSVEIMICR